MRTRNSYFPNNSSVTILRHRNKRRTPNVVEPELRTIVQVAPMADNRIMEELLQAPTEGYGEDIVILEINADHFEFKTNLLQLVQANLYHGFERENPHTHINNFKRITSTLKFRDVPNDRCMMAIFHDMIEKTMEVFMDDFSVFENSFSTCLTNLENMLKRCEDTKLALNWEKSHFMVKEGIVLGYKISKKGIEVVKAKIEVISKLPHLTTVKGI
uniref:Reverse transcriptase domain-containing protein n=1 Tax=Tanacetum cinerariifolium TaxID=118510 RepID=A0A6L2KSV8_TANCI|nr:reverse transcriptase domain-containing protein [Tanacetum cinerariifolium]